MKTYRIEDGVPIEDPNGRWMLAIEVDRNLAGARHAVHEVLDILRPILPAKGASRGGAAEKAFDAGLSALSKLRAAEDPERLLKREGGTTG